MKTEKWFILFLTAALSMVLLMGCGNEATTAEKTVEEVKDASKDDKKEVTGEEETAENTGDQPPAREIPDGFRVTAVGTGSPSTYNTKTWPSILVEYQDKKFLVDCGAGCTNGLVKAGVQPSEISNILFSHHHADHNTDFLTILIAGWATHAPRPELNLIGTKGTQKFYDFAIDFYGEDIQYRIDAGFTSPKGIIENVEITEVTGGEEIELDGVKISTLHVPHSIKTVAYKFEAGGETLVITSDTLYNEPLIEFSKDADLVVMDGMLTEVKEGDPNYEMFNRLKPNLEKGHLSLEEVGKTAAQGNYKKMLLVHLFNGEMDENRTKEIVREQGYEGEVIIAESLQSYEIE